MKRVLFALFGLLLSVPVHAAALPSGYTELTYIESTGTQYINTGIVPNNNTKVKYTFASAANDSDPARILWGSRTSGTYQTSTDQFYAGCTPNNNQCWYYSATQQNVLSSYIPNKKYTFEVINTNATTAATQPIYLFGLNNIGTAAPNPDWRVYSFEVYDDSVLIRNLIPAKNSSGVVGMYDTVSGQFFTNSGSGSFLPGKELDSCRNLFDSEPYKTGYYINANGQEQPATQAQNEYIIRQAIVQPSTTYTISFVGIDASYTQRFHAYDKDGNWISQIVALTPSVGNTTTHTFTTPTNCRYIRQGGRTQADYQLEQGSTVTPYTPYDAQCGGCSGGGTLRNYVSATGTGTQVGTPTPENPIDPVFFRQGDMILRAVGDYKDTFDATTGKITRNVGVKVLDGTEDWDYASARFTLDLSDKINTKVNVLCNYFAYSSATSTNMPDLSIVSYVSKAIGVRYDRFTSVDQFKQYLASQYAAGTPVTLYYPLATPVVEDWDGGATYCETGIKIATNLYNSAKFQNVIDALDTAVSTINNIVAGTIAQANSIGELASGKQTRPNPADSSDETCPTSCPNYRQCLLVEKDDGTPCWYPINDPWYDFTKPILATNTNAASTSYTQGYQQLEYIESTGTQWIDTGITLGGGANYKNTDIKLEYDAVINEGTIWQVSGTVGGEGIFVGVDGSNKISYGGGNQIVTGVTNPYVRCLWTNDAPNGRVTVKNTITGINIVDVTYTPVEKTSSINIFLFNYPMANGLVSHNYMSGKMYGAKIYNKGTLVRDFVPVIQQSTGKYGMYDKVNGVFYPNAAASGDDFTPGPIVENDPGVPRGLWSATWANNSTTGVVGGTASGNARCTNVNASNGAVATAAQLASSAWNTHGRYCWCNLASITIDNAVTPIANGKWVKSNAASSGTYACEMHCSKDYCKSFVATTANLTNLFTTY